MPIVEKTIETAIADLLDKIKKSDKPDDAPKTLSKGLASIIADAIKSATVTVNPGIPVTAPPPTGVGATTASGTGSLS